MNKRRRFQAKRRRRVQRLQDHRETCRRVLCELLALTPRPPWIITVD